LFSNEVFGVRVIISNVIRNASLHVGFPGTAINRAIVKGVRGVHKVLGIDVDDPRTTANYPQNTFYQRWFSQHEDSAGNASHLVLVMVSLGLLFAWRDQRRARDLASYAGALIVAFLMFCLCLKWNPWHSRIQLSLFVLWTPFISVVLLRRAGHRIAASVVVFLMAASTLYVLRNETRPLIGVGDSSTVFNTSRVDQYFRRHSNLRDAYRGAVQFAAAQNCSEVGLGVGDDDLEYPFWVLFQGTTGHRVEIEHVNVRNASATRARLAPLAGFSPCAIVEVEPERNGSAIPDGSGYRKGWSSGPVSVYTRGDGPQGQ